MAQFSYAKKDGSQGTIEAPDANSALKMMPVDAHPTSGVQVMSTPTGLPTLPQGGGGTPALPSDTPSLPQSGGSSSPLLSFADSLDAAVNLARKSRNASSLDMMKPFQGTVAASDFNSILGNLNAASDKTSTNLLKQVSDITNPTNLHYVTNDAGDVTALNPATGATVWTKKGVGNKQGGSASDILTRSGALTYTKTDYSADASALEQSRGTDGWVDPAIYQKLYDAWVTGGGKIVDFVKTYPPETYVNPSNNLLPVYLRPKGGGRSA